MTSRVAGPLHRPRRITPWRPRPRLALMVIGAIIVGALAPVVHAAPPAQAVPFDCTAGVVYALERPATGSLSYVSRVDTATGATTRWPGSFPAQNTNGLALSGDGATAYVVDQPAGGSTTAIFALTSEGVSSTVNANLTVTGVDAGNLVGGAINPVNGYFYFGGYSIRSFGGTERAIFQLHAYDLVSNTYFGRVGTVSIPESTPDSATNNTGNGDIAFDAQGNLYLVWSSTGGVTNKLASIEAASVPTTSGGSLVTATLLSSPASSTNSLSYNGATIDGNGILFLENSNATLTTVAAVDPNSGVPTATAQTVSGVPLGVDLASCSYPPTIRLAKNVTGRYPGNAQFRLSIFRTDVSNAIASATTSGTATGAQQQMAGPAVAVPGRQYRIEESASRASLANYLTTYSCSWGSETTPFASGVASLVGRVKAVTLPTIPTNRSGQELACTFTNSPLTARVTVTKQIQDAFGPNVQPGAGWTTSAVTTATTGTVTTAPAASTQVTDSSGNATWALTFTDPTGRASVDISETPQADYSFVSAECAITSVTGAVRTVAFTSAAGGTITGVTTADSIACSFVNRVKPTYLTLAKTVVNSFGGTATPGSWTLSAVGPTTLTGASGSAGVTRVQVPAGTYDLSETTGTGGYTLTGLACTTAGTSIANPSVTLAVGADVTCTFTNTAIAPVWSLVKSSDPASGSTVLPGTVITYTVTAEPVSGAAATDVIVIDDLSDVLDDATPVDGSIVASTGTTATLTGTGLVWTVGTLTTAATLTYQVTVNADARGASLRNAVTGTGSRPPADCAVGATNCRSTEQFTPGWTLHKSSDPQSGSAVLPGDRITYTLTATNVSQTTITTATAVDDLGGVLAHASVVEPLAGGLALDGETLTWTIPTLDADATASVSFTVRIDADAENVQIRNTVAPGDESGGCDRACSTTHRTPPPPPPIPLPVTGGTVLWQFGSTGGISILLGGLLLEIARRRRRAG